MSKYLVSKIQLFPSKNDIFFDTPDHIRKKIELWRRPYFEFLFGFESHLMGQIPDWYDNNYSRIFHWGLFCGGGSQSTIRANLSRFVEHVITGSGIFDFRLSTSKKCILKASFTGIDYVDFWVDDCIDVFFPEMRKKYAASGVSIAEFVQIIVALTPFFAQIVESDAKKNGY